ncbi:MAG: PEP-CTERM/exosortase system-associated acyltransferase [Methylotetracoccus sp.]
MIDGGLDAFDQYFEIAAATEDADIERAMALRYQVYCVEHSYEDPNSHCDGREHDEFDERAIHSLLMHRKTGAVAATVRLILTDQMDPRKPLPIERYCEIDREAWKYRLANYERRQIAEISRFAVSKQFRRRVGEAETTHGVVEPNHLRRVQEERRALPQITLGLFQAIVRMSSEHDIKMWFAVMEPTLLRLLKRFGIHFVAVGRAIDYHGVRLPCMGPVDEVMEGIRNHCPQVWDFITCKGQHWPY